MPAAVLAQVSWAAARTSLPRSPLTRVGFPGSRAGGAVGRVKHYGISLPRVTWEPDNEIKKLLSCFTFTFALCRGSLGTCRVVSQGIVIE